MNLSLLHFISVYKPKLYQIKTIHRNKKDSTNRNLNIMDSMAEIYKIV
jgi:hypothetical protein